MTHVVLADETWISATHAEVCLAFLRAEWEKVPEITRWHDRRLVDAPDLANWHENSLRRLILGSWREPLLAHIPADTSWWRVRSLRHTHTTELLVIASDDWRDPLDGNELLNVARRRGETLRTKPADWSPPILWGHEREGPFTILEGNNRLVNYAASVPNSAFAVECFVGLSPSPSVWHLPDRATTAHG
jgi:hypothetical protein